MVSLTASGRATATGLRRGRDEMAAQLFDGVPADRLDVFRGVVGTVIERLRAADPEAG